MAIVKAKLRIGYTPEAASAFKFYAIVKGKVNTEGLTISHIVDDIESLNERAIRGDIEAGVISTFAYFQVMNRYALLRSCGMISENYGPVVASKHFHYAKELKGKRIAVPGRWSTSYLTLKFHETDFVPVFLSPKDLVPAIERGDADAAVLAHEKQMTLKEDGLIQVIDIGEWFYEMTRFPLPLGVAVVRTSLPADVMRKVQRVFRESVEYGLKHREEALDYAMKYSRNQPREFIDQLIDMYVNDYSLDVGKKGKNGLQFMCKTAQKSGMVKNNHSITFSST